MKKPLPDKSFSDLRKERDIAQLQQTIRSLRAELHMERSQRQLAEAQVEYLSRNVDDLKTDVAEWQQRYSELLDISESMQRTLYIYEEHAQRTLRSGIVSRRPPKEGDVKVPNRALCRRFR